MSHKKHKYKHRGEFKRVDSVKLRKRKSYRGVIHMVNKRRQLNDEIQQDETDTTTLPQIPMDTNTMYAGLSIAEILETKIRVSLYTPNTDTS